MHSIQLVVAVILIALSCGSCSFFSKLLKKEKPKQESKEPEIRLVGRISSNPRDGKFILIQSIGKWNTPTNTILVSKGTDGRTANLRVTGEKLGQFAAADIQSGTVQIGDGVFTTISDKPPQESPVTETNPQLSDEENTPTEKNLNLSDRKSDTPPSPSN